MSHAHDTRGIAVVVEAHGTNYMHACARALALLAIYYGGEDKVRLHAIMNHRTPSKDVADAGTFRSACVVHALGFHRVGELLRCDRTSNSYVDLPFDHPCIHDRLTSEIASGEATTSTLGQNRGSYVAIQNGIGWKAVQVPSRDWFQINDAGVVFDYRRLPGYGPDKPELVLP